MASIMHLVDSGEIADMEYGNAESARFFYLSHFFDAASVAHAQPYSQ